jgi:hypothetical protein
MGIVMESEDLSSLPVDHILRNLPLSQINAEYKNRDSKNWQSISVLSNSMKDATYNQLGEAWTKWDIWKGSYE